MRTAALATGLEARSCAFSHFMGTLDNWDPAVTDALASGREIMPFDTLGEHLQFHESFTHQAAAFLGSDSPFAPY